MTTTPRFTGPVPTAREIALATTGVGTAAETIAATAQYLDLDHVYAAPAGMSFADHRAGLVLGDPVQLPTAVDETVAGVPVRRFEPTNRPSRGLYLHIHGGGWSMGSHRTMDARLQPIADDTGLTVVTVGYRLAPEHPYPAGIDDVVAVARELAPAAAVAVIGGESAGAHLSALALQRLSGTVRFAGELLTFGMYDLAGSADTDGSRGADLFLPDVPPADRRTAAISPLFGSLRGVPPARFVVGTRDHLLADTLMMAARWRLEADCEVEVVCGAAHAFTLCDIAASRHTRAADIAFLGRLADVVSLAG